MNRRIASNDFVRRHLPRYLNRIAVWLGCVFLLIIALGSCGRPLWAQSETLPNIVLVMADDQGWGDVGFRNPELKTPVMDELAATGLHLTRFYAAAPVCSPTRGSVMTGRHPNRFGCFSWGRTLRPQEITVAEALKKAGYTTGHFGKWHLGMVRADSAISPGASGFDEWFSSPNFFDNDPWMSHNGKAVHVKGESSLVTANAAIDFIRNAVKAQQRFLAVVWFGSPHGPHIAAEEFAQMYEGLPKAKQNFYGEISGIDAAVGKLRQELRDLKIAENTLFWYTSDNGALKVGSAGGLRGGKGNLYEGGLRVPCMIEWPARIKQPCTSEVPGNTVDIYPTLLELAGVQMEHQPVLDGVSLLPLIDGTMDKREKPMGFWVYPAGGVSTRSSAIVQALWKEQNEGAAPDPSVGGPKESDWQITPYPTGSLPGHSAWLDGDFKLHRIPGKQGQLQFELYDLRNDPAETTNIAAEQPERVKRMRQQLEQWQKSVLHSLNGGDY